MVQRLPTDLKLLDAIFRDYARTFASYSSDGAERSSKIWVPIDIEALAKRFGVDPDMVFGRLYYHMNGKYRQPHGDEVLEFFQLRVGNDKHCVNFPFLASVVADLREDRGRFLIATAIAMVSLVISLIAVFVAVQV